LLFNEVPFLERFKAAAQAGFTGVEYKHKTTTLEGLSWSAPYLAAR
jgi:hydroxypyruvate isomerase